MELWVVSEQYMALIKSIISEIIIVLDKHVLEKKINLIVWLQHLSCIQDSSFSSVSERFGICTENKHSIF